MKKNSKSPMKKEPRAKRAKAQRPVQREAKEVLAELVEKLRGKLELKSTSASQAEAGPRGELSPNLNRLTVGLDLGDQWSHFCMLGFEGGDAKRRATTNEAGGSRSVLPGLTAGAGGDGSGDALCVDAGNHRG
jgi:hypothetical protein